MKGILGIKLGMDQLFLENGVVVPVSVIYVENNYVLQVKKSDDQKNNYDAIVLASIAKRESLLTNPLKKRFEKNKIKPCYFIKEIRTLLANKYHVGQILNADVFKKNEFVDVTSISKGKGFQGVIKRYNFHRGPMAHGSNYHRGIGSMGSIAPNRIFKNKKMPGHMGNKKCTIQNLVIVHVDAKNNLLLVKGSIPGPKKSLVLIKSAIKKQNDNAFSKQNFSLFQYQNLATKNKAKTKVLKHGN